MVTYASHYFFICTNYLTFHICNQPCIVFIYTLYIILQIKEKEPLPLSVEVLLHAAARAATFFNCTAAWAVYSVGLLLFVTLTFQSYAVIQTATRPAVKSAIPAVSILCSRTDCSDTVNTIGGKIKCFNLMQSHGLLREKTATCNPIWRVSILCRRVDYECQFAVQLVLAFNLTQPTWVTSFSSRSELRIILILCSYTDCFMSGDVDNFNLMQSYRLRQQQHTTTTFCV